MNKFVQKYTQNTKVCFLKHYLCSLARTKPQFNFVQTWVQKSAPNHFSVLVVRNLVVWYSALRHVPLRELICVPLHALRRMWLRALFRLTSSATSCVLSSATSCATSCAPTLITQRLCALPQLVRTFHPLFITPIVAMPYALSIGYFVHIAR